MKLKSADINVLKDQFVTKQSLYKPILEEFIESQETCCEVIGWTTKTASTAAVCMNKQLKRMGIYSVKARTVKDRLYLIKEV